MKKVIAFLTLVAVLLLAGCGVGQNKETNGENSMGYTQISREKAAEMMEKNDGHIVVDVRRADEYASGHIPGAVLIPNETIGTAMPPELPDTDQVILIYCRSGRRSKEAARKLADIGYKNVYEFGGIIDWTGETVVETAAGTTSVPAASEDTEGMQLYIGSSAVPVVWEDNGSVRALSALLPLEIEMSLYGGFEQVGSIGQSIERSDSRTTTKCGDIMLYSGDQIVLFFGQNTWSYTRLGHIDLGEDEITALLSGKNVTITLKNS